MVYHVYHQVKTTFPFFNNSASPPGLAAARLCALILRCVFFSFLEDLPALFLRFFFAGPAAPAKKKSTPKKKGGLLF